MMVWTISLENDWENTYDPLTAGLSIVFLKFISSRNSLIEVQITKEYSHGVNTNDTITKHTILPNVQLPTTSFDPVNVVKSYPEHVIEYLYALQINIGMKTFWIPLKPSFRRGREK